MNTNVWFALGMILLWGGTDSYRSFKARRSKQTALIVSQSGRDLAILGMIHEAKNSVYVRTERLTLIPAGNEMVQAIQRKAAVTVDLPLGTGCDAEASQLPRLLMEQGAVVSLRSDPSAGGRGTYLVVDGHRFLYSAAPLTVVTPGAQVSYVAGELGQ